MGAVLKQAARADAAWTGTARASTAGPSSAQVNVTHTNAAPACTVRAGKRRRVPAAALLLALLLGAPLAAAGVQDAEAGVEVDQPAPAEVADAPLPGTGDAWIDLRLADMDRYAARYREAFIDEIARYLEAPRELLVDALDRGMRPGDVYYACALARADGRACRGVIDAWRANADRGWPGVAEQLELDPAATLHARIREDIDASYRRWARPVDHLDGS